MKRHWLERTVSIVRIDKILHGQSLFVFTYGEQFIVLWLDRIEGSSMDVFNQYAQIQEEENVPVVWIHDYHLMLAATTIRQVRPPPPSDRSGHHHHQTGQATTTIRKVRPPPPSNRSGHHHHQTGQATTTIRQVKLPPSDRSGTTTISLQAGQARKSVSHGGRIILEFLS